MTYTALEAEAALCIWECFLEERQTLPGLDEHWNAVGTCAMRQHALSLAAFVEAAYDAVDSLEWDGYSYDWEVVPAILGRLTWTAEGLDRPDPAETGRAALASLQQKPEAA